MDLDTRLVYVQWQQKMVPGNYVALTGAQDPVTGTRARLLFMPVNDMIARIRRGDFIMLAKRYGAKVRQLDPDEVPDGIRAVFEKRAAKVAAVKSAAKKPAARKAKKGE